MYLKGKPEFGYCTQWYVTALSCKPAYITFRWKIGQEKPYRLAEVEADGYEFWNSHSMGEYASHVFRAVDNGGLYVDADCPDDAWKIWDEKMNAA